MKDVAKIFFKVLIALNRHDYSAVRKLAKKSCLNYNIVGCDAITSIVFDGRNKRCGDDYYIAFRLNKCTGFYEISVEDADLNLFNTIPQLLVDESTSVGERSDCKHEHEHSKCCEADIFPIIVVLRDFDADAVVERAKEVFHLDVKVVNVNAMNIVRTVEKLIRKGYRYFVGPSYSSNIELLRDIITKHKECKFISPLATSVNVISEQNLLRFAPGDAQNAEVLSLINPDTAFLIITENDPRAIANAGAIQFFNPGSVIVVVNNYLVDTQNAILNNPTLTHVFFSFTSLGQAYFAAVPASTFPLGYVFWGGDSLQLSHLLWGNAINSLAPGFPPNEMKEKYFKEFSNLEYLYADALFYFQSYILTGYRPFAGLTGVIDFDDQGSRIWSSFVIEQYVANTDSVFVPSDDFVYNPFLIVAHGK